MFMRRLVLSAAMMTAMGMTESLAQATATIHGRPFAEADANGDGAITGEEFREFRLRLFERMDTDRSRTISLGEYLALNPAGQKEFMDLAGPEADSLTREQWNNDISRRFTAFDKNRDGKIEPSELTP
jgi:Ca2+-binding EF-hand superfamily protein